MNGQRFWSFSFTPLSDSISLPLQLLPQHEGVMHLIPPPAWKGENPPSHPKKKWTGEMYTHIKGWSAAEALKGKNRAQQEAYYTTKEIQFPDLACTNSNKRQWQSPGSGEWEWGSGPRHFFRGSGTFIAMLIKCFWERVPPTLLAVHTPKTAWLGRGSSLYGPVDRYTTQVYI